MNKMITRILTIFIVLLFIGFLVAGLSVVGSYAVKAKQGLKKHFIQRQFDI